MIIGILLIGMLVLAVWFVLWLRSKMEPVDVGPAKRMSLKELKEVVS